MGLLSTLAGVRNVALFLDVDGTLLEIAATPDAVEVSDALRGTLQRAATRAQGALALISGRSIQDVDRLFAPTVFPVAGQHGLERRTVQGTILRPSIDQQILAPVRLALVQLQLKHPGLLLEDKGTTLAMHYRQAPQCESLVLDIMGQLAAPLADRFQLIAGKYVLEMTPRNFTKRTAIEAFMSETPFSGRTPVFIGDDITDEEGFRTVNALGGYSICVGSANPTNARYRLKDVSAVMEWLDGADSRTAKSNGHGNGHVGGNGKVL